MPDTSATGSPADAGGDSSERRPGCGRVDADPSVASARDWYAAEIEKIDAASTADQARDRGFGFARIIAFLAALVLGFLGLSDPWLRPALWVGVLSFAIFLGLAIAHEQVRLAIESKRKRRRLLQRLSWRGRRDWQRLATLTPEADPASMVDQSARYLAMDLDLFGKASLFQLVSLANTPAGVEALARWLAQPATIRQSRDRSTWIESLIADREKRLDFLHDTAILRGDAGSWQSWTREDAESSTLRWLRRWSVVSGVLAIGLVISAAFLHWVAEDPPVTLWTLLCGLAAINLIVAMVFLAPVNRMLKAAFGRSGSLDSLGVTFEHARWMTDPIRDPGSIAEATRRTLLDDELSAQRGIRDLGVARGMYAMRTGVLTFPIYTVLQLTCLIDVWAVRRLHHWQQRYRDSVDGWFQAVGVMEAVASLAALADENPTWTVARFVESGAGEASRATQESDETVEAATVMARQIGHPLLSDEVRVCNDVRVGPAGTLLLITGSNTSGKSTLMRAVGLNLCLASAGSRVCAEALSLPQIEMATSIRVTDDLSQGVSFYMAELKRLKHVVDTARRVQQQPDTTCLFLLDEILQGTNSREREIAVAKVLQTLLKLDAIGAISTHDLELTNEPTLKRVSETVHFRETIRREADGSESLHFDYQMHPGVCPTTNALRLLEMVGL